MAKVTEIKPRQSYLYGSQCQKSSKIFHYVKKNDLLCTLKNRIY
jgi:hypothetical protein